MIVDKLDVVGIVANPAKAEAPLAVDADAVNAVAAWSCCILASVSAARRDEIPFRGA
jgi:hypothetical protein